MSKYKNPDCMDSIMEISEDRNITNQVDTSQRNQERYQWNAEFSPEPCDGLIHVIRQGDTLYRLSQLYHVTVSDIMYKNPYVNIYNLQVGDELCIPVSRKIMR